MPIWKRATYIISVLAMFKLYSAFTSDSRLYSKSFMNLGDDALFEDDYKSERIVASAPFSTHKVSKRVKPTSNKNLQHYTFNNLAGTWKIVKHEEWEVNKFKTRKEHNYRGEKFYTYLIMGKDKKSKMPFVVLREVSQNPYARIKEDEKDWQISFFERSSEGRGIALTSSYQGDDGKVYVERLQLVTVRLRIIPKRPTRKKQTPTNQVEKKLENYEVAAKLIKSPFAARFYGPDHVSGNLEVNESVLNLDLTTSGFEVPGYNVKNISISNAPLNKTSESMSTAVVDTGEVPYSITVFKKQLSVPGKYERVIHFIGGPYNNIRIHFSDYSYEKELARQEEQLKKIKPVIKQQPQKIQQQRQQYNDFKRRAMQYQNQGEYGDEDRFEGEDEYIEDEEEAMNYREESLKDWEQASKKITKEKIKRFIANTGFAL